LLFVALEGFSRRASSPRSKRKQLSRGCYDAKDDKVGASSFISRFGIFKLKLNYNNIGKLDRLLSNGHQYSAIYDT
jgi:hypothetical protein